MDSANAKASCIKIDTAHSSHGSQRFEAGQEADWEQEWEGKDGYSFMREEPDICV